MRAQYPFQLEALTRVQRPRHSLATDPQSAPAEGQARLLGSVTAAHTRPYFLQPRPVAPDRRVARREPEGRVPDLAIVGC
jgi:hypothetical protein